MLTPQEVQDKKFKQAFVGGYEMSLVDDFLEVVTSDYSTLFRENAVLKNKMRVLVDKIEEYRQNDDAIRQAYLAIKRQADQELENARKEASRLMSEASGELGFIKQQLKQEISDEQKRLAIAKEQTMVFVSALCELYKSQTDKLASIPDMEIKESAKQRREAAVRETVVAIDQSIAPEIESSETEEDSAHGAPTLEFADGGLESGETLEDNLRKKQEKIVNSFEVNFSPGVLEDEIWESEEDTEVPQPKFDFPDLEIRFGSEAGPIGKIV